MKIQVYKSFLIKEELHTKFKTKVAKNGEKLNKVVEDIITKYVNEKKR